MAVQIDIVWLRSWLAEAVRRTVRCAAELWAETEALKEKDEYFEAEDIERWEDAITRVEMTLYGELLRDYESAVGSSVALEHIAQTARDVAVIAAIQLRDGLDGVYLDNLRNFDEWVDDDWRRGTLTIPADPVAVLRLVDSRLRPLLELLRDIDVAVPGAEAYVGELNARVAAEGEYELAEENREVAVVSAWTSDPDSDQRQRFRVRRVGGSVMIERQREGAAGWTDLGTIPAAQSDVVAALLKALQQSQAAAADAPGRAAPRQ